MEANHWQTQTNRINTTLSDYSLIKKYVSGYNCINKCYELLTAGMGIHEQLLSEELKIVLEKETIMNSIFKIHLPYKDVKEEDLKPTRSKDNYKNFKNVVNNIDGIIGKPVILNIYSNLGEQATMAVCYLTQILSKKYRAKTTNGIEINQKSVDFDSGGVSELLKNQFLVVFSVDKVFTTEHRKQYLDNLYSLAKLQNIPIILSSKKELKNTEYRIINLRLTDDVKNEMELIIETFGIIEQTK